VLFTSAPPSFLAPTRAFGGEVGEDGVAFWSGKASNEAGKSSGACIHLFAANAIGAAVSLALHTRN